MSKKSLYKTISWRITSIIVGFTITYLYLGSIKAATTLAVLHNVVATVLYYYHELLYKVIRRKKWLDI